jgi:ATP-dependent exoDNAse (exonuclease V) beta subunit
LKKWKDVIDVEKSEFFKGIRQAKINEEKRLLYVGMTRPKEQLILATFGKEGKNSKDNGDNLLTEIGCSSIDSHNTEERINWGGYDWKHERCEHIELEEKEVVEPKDIEVLKQPAEPSSYNDKFISPSKVEFEKPLYTVEQCGEFANRISITAKDVAADKRDSTIGDFIHHLMCLWSGDKSIIEPMAKAYGVEVDIDAVATSIEGFWSWMKMHYGEAKEIKRELPFSFANNGQVVSGRIDLVYCTAEGDVLVDYKTYQGKVDNIIDTSSDFYAGKKYAGEFSLYEEALRRSGSAICDRLICYFTLGIMVKMR